MATLNTSDLNRQGKVFSGANVASQAITAVATSMTGLILYNPYGSGRKLSLIDVGVIFTIVATAVTAVGLAVALPVVLAPTSVTAITVQNADCSGPASNNVGRLYSAATFVTAPITTRWFGGNVWVTGGTGDHPYSLNDKVEGAVVVVPGAAVMLSVISAVSGAASMTWAEYNV
jgi:hypothetical protein